MVSTPASASSAAGHVRHFAAGRWHRGATESAGAGAAAAGVWGSRRWSATTVPPATAVVYGEVIDQLAAAITTWRRAEQPGMAQSR